MKIINVDINIFPVTIVLGDFHKDEVEERKDELRTFLESLDIPHSLIDDIIYQSIHSYECGDCKSNPAHGFAMVSFYNLSKAIINVSAHEKRHLEDFILSYLNIKDKETAAYLAGYLAEIFDDFLNKERYISKDKEGNTINNKEKYLKND
jgi:hypothetical protein